MKNTKLALLVATTTSAAMMSGSASAALLAEWTFNDGGTTAARLASSNNAAGVTVSGLLMNDSFSNDDVGPGAIPNSNDDGIGFGGNSGEQAVFLRSATYLDGGAPAGKWTSWGPASSAGTGATSSADGNAPIAFTVTAGASQTVTIESIFVDYLPKNSDDVTLQFQDAGASGGSSVTFNGTNTSDTVALTAPVVIGPGSSKTFTISLDGGLDADVNLNEIELNGTVVPEPGSLALLAAGGLLIGTRRRRG